MSDDEDLISGSDLTELIKDLFAPPAEGPTWPEREHPGLPPPEEWPTIQMLEAEAEIRAMHAELGTPWNWFKLDAEHNPVEAHIWEAEQLLGSPERVVAQTRVGRRVWVSTVFLVMDHQMPWHAVPVLFETMIFGGRRNEESWRYGSWLEAETNHWRVVRGLLREAPPMTKKLFRLKRALGVLVGL